MGVHIEPEYAHLVNTSTRFWNSSGITLTGNLSGVQVKSESLQTLITGGISFDTLDPKAPTVTKVRRFTLFDSEEAAMARGVEIQLSIDNADAPSLEQDFHSVRLNTASYRTNALIFASSRHTPDSPLTSA